MLPAAAMVVRISSLFGLNVFLVTGHPAHVEPVAGVGGTLVALTAALHLGSSQRQQVR